MPTGFTTITASNIQDGAGKKLVSGRVVFFPVNSEGLPVSFIAAGGVVISRAVTFIVGGSGGGQITGNLFGGTAQVADTTLTNPQSIGYRVTVLDENGIDVTPPNWTCVQPSGSTWSLDTFVPAQPGMTVLLVGGSGGGSSFVPFGQVPTGTVNGSNTSFALTVTPSLLSLFVNGVFQIPGVDYTLSGSAITFIVAPLSGDSLFANGGTNASTVNVLSEVPSGTVNSSNNAFTLSHAPSLLSLYRNGILQVPVADYTLSGSSITFITTPQTGDSLYAQGIY